MPRTAVVRKVNDPDSITPWAIKVAREFRGITREAFAERLSELTSEKWDYRRVEALENGRLRATFQLVSVIASELRVDLKWFSTGLNAVTVQ